MTIVINTPNSHIGRRVTQRLLDSEIAVDIITRNPDKVRDLSAQGASVLVGSCDDQELLTRAFEGAEAVFWLTPPAYRPDYNAWVRATASKAASALHGARVEHVVNVSSIGAHAGPETGPIAVLGDVESILSEAAPNVVHLRPGSFMENHLADVPTIASAGAIYSPLPRNAAMATIATCDIADVAATYLLGADWTGKKVHELRGPRDLTGVESASLIAKGIDKPVEYVEISIEQSREAMAQAGLPDFVVDLYSEMFLAMKEGRIAPEQPRTSETTTPTGLVQFAREVLKPAVEAAASKTRAPSVKHH
ncbi:MAG: NmrA family transcriptional regulator [Acidobacteria bacterium]|nr:MAG: NmrA family transcriptional regulator [Acidobacteriota bacterium]